MTELLKMLLLRVIRKEGGKGLTAGLRRDDAVVPLVKAQSQHSNLRDLQLILG